MSTTESTNFKRLERRLYRQAGQAIGDYRMIGPGDRVLVCLSGGKDSYTLLNLLLGLQRRAPVAFTLVAMNLDQKQPGFPEQVLPDYLSALGVDYHIVTEDTYSIVKEKIPEGKTTCGLCSRLRRGIIYRTARELGATRIALGHHRDDIIETFFLNLFFAGRLKAMPPRLQSDDGEHTVIRPLAYCSEQDIARYARALDFPIIPCNLCGSQDQLQRQQIKAMLAGWRAQYPDRPEIMFRALQNAVPSHLLDRGLFAFTDPDAGNGAVARDALLEPGSWSPPAQLPVQINATPRAAGR